MPDSGRMQIVGLLVLIVLGACSTGVEGGDAVVSADRGQVAASDDIESLRAEADRLFESRRPRALLDSATLRRRILELDGDDAVAHAELASTLCLLALYSVLPPSEALPAAQQAAEAAVARAPSMAAPHAALGLVNFLYHWQWDQAEEHFRRAIVLDPSDATVHHWYAMLLSARGRFAEAVEVIDRALELAPRSRIINVKRGTILARAGRLEEAEAQLMSAISLFPDMDLAWRELGFVHLRRGDPETAVEAFERGVELAGDILKAAGGLAVAYAATGHVVEAQGILSDLLERPTDDFVPPMMMAQTYAALERPNEAMEWLLEGERSHDPGLVYLAVKPGFESLRGREDHQELLARLGL